MSPEDQALIDAASRQADEDKILKDKTLQQIAGKYSRAELESLARGKLAEPKRDILSFDFGTEEIRILNLSDTHIGSLYDCPEGIERAIQEGKNKDCHLLALPGDIVDGMGLDKKGYINDLRVIGHDAQRDEACNLLSSWTREAFVCAGNHDAWYFKESKSDIVNDICSKLGTNWHHLGMGGGDFKLGNILVRLFHGEDSGSSYAYSYRIQQITRAMTGGDKPNILITGHDHKALYVFSRMIHCVGSGACSLQSRWSQMKRLEHHAGFWIFYVTIGKLGITSFRPEWFPFYA